MAVTLLLLVSVASLLVIPAASQGSTTTVTNTSFTVQGFSSDTCYYHEIPLGTGWMDSELSGSVSSDSPIHFYVMTYDQLLNFQFATSRHCGFIGQAAISANQVGSYSFHWLVPDNDNYYFIFLNPNSVTVNVNFVLWKTTTQAYTYQQPVYTTPIYATASTPYYEPPIEWTIYMPFAIFAVVALIVVSLLVVALRKELAKKKGLGKLAMPRVVMPRMPKIQLPRIRGTSGRATRRSPKKVQGRQFCIECGNTLSLGSKFCNKCGTKQP